MDILGAAHRIGHDYPGSMDSLAPRMGCNPRVLNNKLNPSCGTHHLTLLEAFLLQQLTGKADILFAMADGLGFVCLPRPDVEDTDVTISLAKACSEFGDYVREASAAMTDGRITPNELKRLERELAELIGAATALQATLAAKAARGRSRS